MKIEKRGKYPGVKVHLEPEEVKAFMESATYDKSDYNPMMVLSRKLGKKLNALVKEEPDTLTERTPEQVAEVVALELKTATQKMEALKKGKLAALTT